MQCASYTLSGHALIPAECGLPDSLDARGLTSRPPAFPAIRKSSEGGPKKRGRKEDFWGRFWGRMVFACLETAGQNQDYLSAYLSTKCETKQQIHESLKWFEYLNLTWKTRALNANNWPLCLCVQTRPAAQIAEVNPHVIPRPQGTSCTRSGEENTFCQWNGICESAIWTQEQQRLIHRDDRGQDAGSHRPEEAERGWRSQSGTGRGLFLDDH